MVDTQEIKALIEDVKKIRRLIKTYQNIAIPEIACCLRIADINLHEILWVSGEATQYLPDLPLED